MFQKLALPLEQTYHEYAEKQMETYDYKQHQPYKTRSRRDVKLWNVNFLM